MFFKLLISFTANENRWERTTLPSLSSFSPSPVPAKVSQNYNAPDTSSYQTKTFHCTPELRYKPVYFGDPRLRRFSCGYSERRNSKDITVSGLQEFCQTMLAVKTPNENFQQTNDTNAKDLQNNKIASQTVSKIFFNQLQNESSTTIILTFIFRHQFVAYGPSCS